MRLALVFALVFVVGPVLFHLGLRLFEGREGGTTLLALATSFLALSGFAMQFVAGAAWGADIWVTVPGIALVWLGWIGLIVLGAMRLRAVVPGSRPAMRRGVAALGAIGTTIPWFGLASARMVAG